jgi:hypothetical protein
MKIIDIWNLTGDHTPESLFVLRSIKYSVRVLWPELAHALDDLCLDHVKEQIAEGYAITTMPKNEIPNYGILYPIKYFIEKCMSNFFIDYDGYGMWSDGKFYYGDSYKDMVYPSDIAKGKIKLEFSHVLWFNR